MYSVQGSILTIVGTFRESGRGHPDPMITTKAESFQLGPRHLDRFPAWRWRSEVPSPNRSSMTKLVLGVACNRTRVSRLVGVQESCRLADELVNSPCQRLADDHLLAIYGNLSFILACESAVILAVVSTIEGRKFVFIDSVSAALGSVIIFRDERHVELFR
jgi:hypothetical protein